MYYTLFGNKVLSRLPTNKAGELDQTCVCMYGVTLKNFGY